MKNSITRLLLFFIAIPLIFVLILAVPFFHHIGVNIIVILISAIGASELGTMYAKRGYDINTIIAPIIGAAVPLSTYLEIVGLIPQQSQFFIIIVLVYFLFFRQIFIQHTSDLVKIMPRLATSLTILFYPGLFLSFIVRMSTLPHPSLLYVLFAVMVFLNDSTAWLFGVLWGGKSKAGILVSMNKSIIGFFGGIVGSIGAATIMYYLFPQLMPVPYLLVAAFSIVIGAATIMGDLVESAIKRSAEVKDSGNIIPGRGGILDSIDSLLFSAPLFYIFFAMITG
ncbi:MAG: phosphatidate cytidylyltransferase [Spirochaetales bacterium]|nr:phosphatidate cytidylyltransferase [Spirochaetales bacterium]MCF7937479.1 phosphatidate cytidylyltransferase [Spirochaetales bacterium]